MKKILLVEDDPNLGLLLQDYLQLKGKFDVVLCKDGEEGLRMFTKSAYDLLILDVMMPKKDGFTLGKDIRKINSHVPIIFATAKGMIEDKTQAFNLGGDDYITKPFRIEELLLRINALLKRTGNSEKSEEEKQTTFKIGRYVFEYTSQIISIFLAQGMVVGIIGVVTGLALGMTLIRWRNEVSDALSSILGIEIFPRSVYQFSQIPAEVVPSDVALICISAFIICSVAALIPAWLAARLDPVKALRCE